MTCRFTCPEEVADLIVLLASYRAGNVTGSELVIDSGLIAALPDPCRVLDRAWKTKGSGGALGG